MSKIKIINLEKWERKEQYLFFKDMDYPHCSICINVDISNFYPKIKEQNLSFYQAVIYASMTVLNKIDNFKYRIKGDNVVLYDEVHPSFTDMNVNSDLFKIVVVNMEDSLGKYVRKALEVSKKQDCFIEEESKKRDDLVYITSIPWVCFTQLNHATSFNKGDAIPRISWGKYFKEGDKLLLPFSVQAHHALVDGVHIGKYINNLQKYFDEYKN